MIKIIRITQWFSDIRSSISGAFDLVQLLPDGLKIHFAEEAVMLGTQLSGFDKMEEAANLLQIAVSSISLLRSDSSERWWLTILLRISWKGAT